MSISKGHFSSKLIQVCGALREEISHWLFLEIWDDPLPWRDERHVRVSVAIDASNFVWGGSLISPVSAGTVLLIIGRMKSNLGALPQRKLLPSRGCCWLFKIS